MFWVCISHLYQTLAWWLECLAMAQKTWVQYQRLKKMVLDSSLLNTQHYKVRNGSRVKKSNPGKGVAPSPTPWCSSYRKGNLWVDLDNSRQLYLYHMCNFIFNHRIVRILVVIKKVWLYWRCHILDLIF